MLRPIAAGLVAASLLMGAGSAQAEVRLGLHPDHLADTDIARMGQGGAKVMRLPLDWRLVEPFEGAPYDFVEHDRIIRAAAIAGIQVLPLIGFSTPWTAETAAEQPDTKSGLAQHDTYVRAMVRRYKPGGDFWVANPGIPQLPLTEWQIWNEPNLTKHWTGPLHPKHYVPFLKRVRQVVLGEDPEAGIVLAGMPEFHQEYPCSDFIRDLYKIKGVQRLFDTVAVNTYMRRTKGLETVLRRLRSLMDKNGDKEKDIWISEMGWASDGPKRNEAVTDIEGQAENLAEGFRLLKRRDERYRLSAAVWYTLKDHELDPRNKNVFWYHTGLFALDGTPKPSWLAFTEATGGDPGTGPL